MLNQTGEIVKRFIERRREELGIIQKIGPNEFEEKHYMKMIKLDAEIFALENLFGELSFKNLIHEKVKD